MTDATQPEMGALDPVQAFEQTLNDLYAIVQIFSDDDSPISPEEFLAASRAAGERLKALSMFTLAGMMSPVAHKIPPDVRDDFERRVTIEEMNLTEDERQRKMLKTLRSIATIFPRH